MGFDDVVDLVMEYLFDTMINVGGIGLRSLMFKLVILPEKSLFLAYRLLILDSSCEAWMYG